MTLLISYRLAQLLRDYGFDPSLAIGFFSLVENYSLISTYWVFLPYYALVSLEQFLELCLPQFMRGPPTESVFLSICNQIYFGEHACNILFVLFRVFHCFLLNSIDFPLPKKYSVYIIYSLDIL